MGAGRAFLNRVVCIRSHGDPDLAARPLLLLEPQRVGDPLERKRLVDRRRHLAGGHPLAEDLGVDADVVLYMKTPPDRAALTKIVDGLEDPVEDLVRKDSRFKKLELDPDDYVDNPEAVIDLLVEQKALLQRPIVVKGKKAIIGRPKDRIAQFLS